MICVFNFHWDGSCLKLSWFQWRQRFKVPVSVVSPLVSDEWLVSAVAIPGPFRSVSLLGWLIFTVNSTCVPFQPLPSTLFDPWTPMSLTGHSDEPPLPGGVGRAASTCFPHVCITMEMPQALPHSRNQIAGKGGTQRWAGTKLSLLKTQWTCWSSGTHSLWLTPTWHSSCCSWKRGSFSFLLWPLIAVFSVGKGMEPAATEHPPRSTPGEPRLCWGSMLHIVQGNQAFPSTVSQPPAGLLSFKI